MVIKIISLFSLWITINNLFLLLLDKKTKYNNHNMSIKLLFIGLFFGVFMFLFLNKIRKLRKEEYLYSKYLHLKYTYSFLKEYLDDDDETYREYIMLKRHFAIKKLKK
jgi:hypothetical protein